MLDPYHLSLGLSVLRELVYPGALAATTADRDEDVKYKTEMVLRGTHFAGRIDLSPDRPTSKMQVQRFGNHKDSFIYCRFRNGVEGSDTVVHTHKSKENQLILTDSK